MGNEETLLYTDISEDTYRILSSP